jgi:hypothetical protein
MRFRRLRIAFSATCLTACVLLIVLWVRSYWWVDTIAERVSATTWITGWSVEGQILWMLESNPNDSRPAGWNIDKVRIEEFNDMMDGNPYYQPHPFGSPVLRRITFDSKQGAIPYWFSALVAATVATLPWLCWRFSLRTLLIATTLVALVLGAIVYAVR